ncbi:hypothetical protein SNE40_012653 [Patella caerulea]|uniref:Ubiquitin-like domain-containing protein n=1 Tax=Patella caerulea TaxID=87958 RepID=A0AAN8JMD9_PATCE
MGYVEEKDMINLTILYDEINIRVSRNQTIREVEAIIQEEYRRRYHISDVDDYIYNIYSKKQNRRIYDSFNNNNKDLPLSFYGIENGDEVEWWSH